MARILVAGGSLGGLFAANILHRQGHDVQVLEKATESLDGRGAGIVTHKALVDSLLRAGAKVDASLGVAIEGRVSLSRDGQPDVSISRPQVLTSWSRLYHMLHEILPADCHVPGACVKSVSQDAQHVTVHCEDTCPDLVVSAAN